MTPPPTLWTNPRFYILAASAALAATIWAVENASGGGDLVTVRLSEIYGFISFALIGAALLVTPVVKLVPALPQSAATALKYARRALGVSAFGFAALHAAVGFFGQLGGFAGLGFLPGTFVASVILGTMALAVLFLLASLSFDAAIRTLTFPRWKRVQRLVYVAFALVAVHMLLIGSHFSHGIQVTGGVAIAGLVIVAAAEIIRIVVDVRRRHTDVRSA